MGDVMILWVDHESVHPPDAAIAGMHRFAPAHLDLARRNTVVKDDLRIRQTHAGHAAHAARTESVVGPFERLPLGVAHPSAGLG